MADGTVVSIGTFDGVHLGHQAILAEVRRQADENDFEAIAYAFARPPRYQFEEGSGRFLLLPESVKSGILLRTVDRVVRVEFSEVRMLSPEGFAETILAERLRAKSVVVGPSFRFGAGRSGDPEVLRALGARFGFSVTLVPPVLIGGEPVSSTRIRSILTSGDVGKASMLLGRPALLLGDVVRGDRIGHRLGYPTANLSVNRDVLLPAHGVYVAHAFFGRSQETTGRPALFYVGTRPTVASGNAELRCEVHLLDTAADASYGAHIEVHLLDRLRGDLALASLAELRGQIARDVARAREILAESPIPSGRIGS